MKRKSTVLILDAGHGGIDTNGNYTTAPSKQKLYPKNSLLKGHKGSHFFEGVFNRDVVYRAVEMISEEFEEPKLIFHPFEDTSLGRRTRRANEIAKTAPCVLISNHANASRTGLARGFELHTLLGQTKSDSYATDFFIIAQNNLKQFDWRFRMNMTDGDVDFESNFQILRDCEKNIPCFLVEWGFFDNLQEARVMVRKEFIDACAKTIFDFYKTLP